MVVCPLTRAGHVSRLYPSDVLIRAPEAARPKDSVVLTLQVRAMAKTRLLERLGAVAPSSLAQIDQAPKVTHELR